MWQRSYFYNKARFATHGWHLRWLTVTNEKAYSVPDRTDAEKHRLTYPKFTSLDVDEERHILRIVHPDPEKRNFYLKAPSKRILDRVVEKLEMLAERNERERKEQQQEGNEAELELPQHLIDDDPGAEERHSVEGMVDFPSHGSNLEVIIFLLLFPFRFLIHWTVPDVRALKSDGDPAASLGTAFLAVLSCLLWLVAGSYAMVASLEALADLMNIPPAVVGVTVSAVGTSLPNYVASRVAARAGFGVSARFSYLDHEVAWPNRVLDFALQFKTDSHP